MRPLRYLLVLSFFLFSGQALSQCNTPSVTGFSNIQTQFIQVQYTCCQAGIYYFEYGPPGFTPGTTASAGPGGAVVVAPGNSGSQVIYGLVANTLYDIYTRVQCNAGGWTSNSIVKTFRTGFTCSSAQNITCDVDYQVALPSGLGSWSNFVCSASGNKGREKLYRYTAPLTGNYLFYAGNSSGTSNRVSFRYRSDTLLCNEANWNCLLTAQPGAPNSVQFGPLIAGKTYLILADASSDTIPPDTATFKIACPQISCPLPTGFTVSSPTVSHIVVNFNGSDTYFEYGPPGFIPGNDFSPGVGGTVSNVYDGSELAGAGLIPGQGYHGYLRSYCNQGGNSYFTPNLGPVGFVVKPCNPLWTYNPTTGPLAFVFNDFFNLDNNYPGACYNSWDGLGADTRFQFVCPKSGSYNAIFEVSPYNNLEFGMKSYSAACSPSNYNCINVAGGNANTPFNIPLGVLVENSVYDFIIDTRNTDLTYVDFRIECESPNNITATNIGPSGFDLNWSCNCADTVFLEIGGEGFTPGTGYLPGPGATLITALGTSYTFNNLQPFTKYDVYLRTHCGTYFTVNKKISVFTPKDCSQAPTVTCGDNVNHVFTFAPSYDPQGPWAVQTCNGGTLRSEEFIWKFTPTLSGMHKIQIYALTSNWTGYAFKVNYFYKHDSLGCTPDSWNCIGQVTSNMPSFTPQEFLFGPLTAGETYYIMSDGDNFLQRYHTFHSRLLCPGICSGPAITGLFPLHPDGVKVYASCGSCTPNSILEIGPQGFTPGTGTQPGVNGTVHQNVAFPYTINGLNTGTTYDVYIRADCSGDTTGFTNGFSTNSGPLSVAPCSTTPGPITSSISVMPICEGDSVVLYRNGGIAAPGTVYRWYENGCGSGNFIGTGDSIVITPTSTTTYYLRAEAPCGNTNCVSMQILVANTPPAFTGTTSFCPGDSTIISVQLPFQQYLWNTGDTTASIIVNTQGLYTLTAINNNGCQVSDSVFINEIPFNPPQISGNMNVCVGDSTILFAGNGYDTYIWSDGSVNPFITIIDSGMYAVTVSVLAGCTGSDSVQVTMSSPPVVNITAQNNLSFCLGDSVLLSSSPGLTGWQWYRSQNPIPGATDPQLWIKTAGTYFCIGSDSLACADTSNMLTAFTRCIIIGSPQEKVNPDMPFYAMVLSNPSGEPPVVRVQCPESAQIDFQLFDSLGKLVSVSADIIKTGEYILSFSGRAGIYILQVRCGNEVRNLKLIR